MRANEFECSVLLEKALKRHTVVDIVEITRVPSYVFISFKKNGDFRGIEDSVVDTLLRALQFERKEYAMKALTDFSNEEILEEIRRRLRSG